MIFQKIIKGLTAQKQSDRWGDAYRNLIRHEAKIGGQLFGPVQPGGKREFFCMDPYTWVWHEEWVGKDGKPRQKTTRYEIQQDTVLKSVNGQYKPVSASEMRHLRDAIGQYGQRVYEQMYSRIPR